jgi:hypothetical protein
MSPGSDEAKKQSTYALRRGRMVKSRTCASRVERCIASSLLMKGESSAINSSANRSRIWRSCEGDGHEVSRSSIMLISRASASRSSEESVGVALSFSILET